MSESHVEDRDDNVCTDTSSHTNEPLEDFSFASNTPIRSAYILQKTNDQDELSKDGVKEDVENEDSDFAILHAMDSSYSQISPLSSAPSEDADDHSEIIALDGTRDQRSVSGSTFSEQTLYEEDEITSRNRYHVSDFEMDKIEFRTTGASVVRANLIPICLFVGRVSWDRRTEWEIRFRQKQLVQLHMKLVCYLLWNKVLLHKRNGRLTISDWIRFVKRLPWTMWREKLAKNRVEDAPLVQHYIRTLISEANLEHSEVLLSFLEISPLRNRTRYGPSLKEGYAHLRINGAFQLPLYRCFNSTIETLYRHLYRTWMRIAFASTVVMFILPVVFVVIANLPQFLGIKRLRDERIGDEILFNRKRFFVGIVTLSILAYIIAFVYMFFKHRLGVIRRWVVLKPSCIAAYRHRKDREPSEVFLFDQKFSATKGNFRQGVSWMPNGLLVGSDAGFLELDTGHYYGRITSFMALCLVSYLVILTMPWSFNYRALPPVQDPLLRAQAVRPDQSVVQANYCGYYFTAPKDINVNVDDQHVTIIQLEKNSNTSNFYTIAQSLWLGTNNDLIKGTILAHMVTKHTIVGILKKNDPDNDQYYSSGESFPVNGLGPVSLQGIHASSLSTIITSPQFCYISVRIGVYTWTVFARFVLILLFGGFMAAALGLLFNYLLSFFGIWHAHIRRDHWFRCIQHLQTFRSNTTAHRYNSFAPERISSKVDSTASFVKPKSSKQLDSSLNPKQSKKHVSGLKRMDIHPRRLEPTGTKNPHIAFEPHERENAACSVSWHVDGEDTFEAMYHAIRNAKHEILIAGWWICPDLFLIRPGRKLEGVKEMSKEKRVESDTQLRNLLLQKAEEGVRIYILIYREVKLALTLNSQYTKRSLNVHSNIHVLRDPIFQIQSLGFWSHHEKIVCIDQSLAFVGGLDLCFGRYDHSGHPLSDGDPKKPDAHIWLGKDYSNPIIKDFVRVNKPFEDLVDRASVPRMPWHDVHCSIAGPAAQDVAYHFIQRWNFVCSKNDYQLRTGWCICLRSRRFRYLPKCILPMDFDGWKLCYNLDGVFPPLIDGESNEGQHPGDVNGSHLMTPTTTTTFRSNTTAHRYNSFAPERISSKVDSTASFVKPKSSKQLDSSLNPKQSKKHVSGLKRMDIHPRRLEPTGTKNPHIAFEPHERENAACSVSWHVDGEDTFEAMYHAIRNAKHEILIAGWWICPDLFLIRPGRKLEGVKEMSKEKRVESDTQLRNLLLQKAEEGVRIYILIYREVKLALTLNSQYTKRSLNVHSNIHVLRDPIFQIQSLGFWSHHEKIVCIDQSLAFVGGLDLCFGRYDHSGHPLSDGDPKKPDAHIWLGKDYSNPIIKDFVRVNKPFEDLVDRASVPRMPWHDVHCSIAGPAAQDVAYHFIQRWNFVCSKNDYQLRTGWCICLRSRRFRYLPKCILPMDFDGWKLCYNLDGVFPPLIDGESNEGQHPGDVNGSHLMTPTTTTVFSSFHSRWETNGNGDTVFNDSNSQHRANSDHYNTGNGALSQKFFPELAARERSKRPMPPQDVSFVGTKPHPHSQKVHVQVVRSASLWSAGVNTESSIHEAYLEIIARSKHYIYIENQFFISGMNSNHVVSNRILQALVDRIRRAVEENQVFRVYVLMPLLPAFEGNIRSEELTNLHAVMHWQFATICRGRHSLFSELRQFTNEPEDYVAFFGLRNYGIMPNGCVSTEQIYIHSKLLIADDCYVIIGSANINDRSMLGYRDSEIAVVIEDMEFTDGLMNGKTCRRGVAASSLRMQLFREHLGLSKDDHSIEDLLAEHSWQRIKNISSQNTETFERVFNCAPSNQMRAFASFQNIEITQIYENQRLNMIKGRGRQVWDWSHLKDGDYAPWTDVNGVPIPLDRFDLDDFEVDTRKDNGRKKLYSMDNDGWCYARNFEVFQQFRTGSDEITKREKLQHFMTDRIIAQVRRRRWVKKGTAATQALSMILLDGVDDEELHGFRAMLKRHHNSFLHRAHSFAGSLNLPIGSHGIPLHSEGTPKTPKGSIPHSTGNSGFSSERVGKALSARRSADMMYQSNERLSVPLPSRASRRAGTSVETAGMRLGDEDGMARRLFNGSTNQKGRQSLDSLSRQLGASIKRFLDHPVDFGRHSRFAAEYFDQDEEEPGEDYLDDSERSSWMSLHTPGNCSGPKSSNADAADGDCQIGHVQTAAVIPKGVEMRARGMLSDIQGHLVDFPLDFLVEEMLKPPIMPADIHI
ncbi:hypothetical protein ABG067_001669 [Albugo candida]